MNEIPLIDAPQKVTLYAYKVWGVYGGKSTLYQSFEPIPAQRTAYPATVNVRNFQQGWEVNTAQILEWIKQQWEEETLNRVAEAGATIGLGSCYDWEKWYNVRLGMDGDCQIWGRRRRDGQVCSHQGFAEYGVPQFIRDTYQLCLEFDIKANKCAIITNYQPLREPGVVYE